MSGNDNVKSADRPRILIPVTCAWTVRNVLLSGLAGELRKNAALVFGLPEGRDFGGLFEGWDTIVLPDLDCSDRRHAHIRQRLGRAHFQVASRTVADSLLRLYRRNASFASGVVITLNTWRARFESSPARYRWLVEEEYRRWMAINRWSEGRARALLRPFDAVIFPAPHSSRERWLARWARMLGLKTITTIHSFDNPTTTSRHFITYDRYLVWNARMRDELRRIYPEIPGNAFVIAGTPHFSFYFRPELQGCREDLARRFALDPVRPILLYAGGPKSLVPHEIHLVARLAEDLREIPEPQRPQLIVRPHPIERDFARWDLLRRYPEIRWSLPWADSAANAEWAIPTEESLREFCMLVRHADVLINSCSTMSIDAAVCDTPAILLDYVLPPFEDFAPFMHRYYDWDHYRPVVASGAARIARSPQDLVGLVRTYTRQPDLDREARAKLADDMCGEAPDRAVGHFAEIIRELVGAYAEQP